MQLTDDQAKAIDAMLAFLVDPNQKKFILAGHSGTGKTFVLKHFLNVVQQRAKILKQIFASSGELNLLLTATTNKAAEALANATGMDTSTIHSALGLAVFNDYTNGTTKLKKTDKFKVLYNTLIVVDEASMADSTLMKFIDEATIDCKVIYVGDPNQLLPLFSDSSPVFDSNIENRAMLNEVRRQAEGSSILSFGSAMRDALINKQKQIHRITPSSEIILCDGTDFQKEVDTHFADENHQNKILAWTNNRVHDYNDYVRSLYTDSKHYIAGERLITNSPVMGSNSQMLFSAETELRVHSSYPAKKYQIDGQYLTVSTPESGRVEVFVANNQFDVAKTLKHYRKLQDWVSFFGVKEGIADVRPAHASTVHKAQGSTYQNVFVDLDDIGSNNKADEVIRLLYVALTRASEKVYLYGDLPARYYF